MRTADTFPGYSPDDLLGPLNDVERENAPERLYVVGAPSLLNLGTRVSIVGSRKASPIGLRRARRLARTLAEHGVIVVSGLAGEILSAVTKGADPLVQQRVANRRGGTLRDAIEGFAWRARERSGEPLDPDTAVPP